MNIQLTNKGVELLNSTKKPLEITKYILGSSYGYTPSETATGITGDQVYTNTPVGPEVINANVYKYSIALDYTVGPFYFGEIAYYVGSDCVAVAVSEELIEKKSLSNSTTGTSMVLDAYLSMVADNYSMWMDSIGSDIKFQVPVINNIDSLPSVAESDPNCYIIAPISSQASATLAYTNGSTGLWNFDTYTFQNLRTLTVTSATSTQIVCDISTLNADEKNELTPQFFGDKLVEFSSGACYSICRCVSSVRTLGTQATISFRTPLAIVPSAGDTVMYFSRTQVSISTLMLPVATKDTLGGIIVGAGMDVTPEGVVSVNFPVESVNGYTGVVELTINDIKDASAVAISGEWSDILNKPATFTPPVATTTRLGGIKVGEYLHAEADGTLTLDKRPVESVNGITPDAETGNIEISTETLGVSGLINPKQIPTQTNINGYRTSGLYYGVVASSIGLPSAMVEEENGDPFTLEVVNNTTFVMQRVTSNDSIYYRVYDVQGQSWTSWLNVLTNSKLPIASSTVLGIMSVGAGLSVSNGKVSANVTSVNGRTGDVVITGDDVSGLLTGNFNKHGGIAGLAKEVEGSTPGHENQDYFEIAGRMDARNSAFGMLYLYGTWDAQNDTISDNEDPNVKIRPGGKMVLDIGIRPYGSDDAEYEANYQEVEVTGYLIEVTTASTTRELDGITGFYAGDILLASVDKWVRIYSPKQMLAPSGAGFVSVDANGNTRSVTVSGNNGVSVQNGNGQNSTMTISLTNTGVTAGEYAGLTVDAQGRVTSAVKRIRCGTF